MNQQFIKAICACVLGVGIPVVGAEANEFSYTTGTSYPDQHQFVSVGEADANGWMHYEETITSVKLKSVSVDQMFVNCKLKKAIVYWGPTTMNDAATPLSGGSSNITNKADLQKILHFACEA